MVVLAALVLGSAPFDELRQAPAIRGSVLSVRVERADGKLVFAWNDDVRVVPASNQKLFSTAFALETLGPDFQPSTRFWKEGDRIYVDAPGDPSLTFQALREAKAKLGIGEKPVQVWVKQAFAPLAPSSWNQGDFGAAYSAPITAFQANRGRFEIIGEGKDVRIDPAEVYLNVKRYAGGKPSADYDFWQDRLTINGDMPEAKTTIATFGIRRPDQLSARVLGGTLVPTDSVPGRDPDHVITGKRLAEIAKDCLTPSDNTIAEHLLLITASRLGSMQPSAYPAAQARLAKFLEEQVGLTKDDILPIDGSGLSRQNLVTTRGICKLLQWADARPWSKVWHEALARPGQGTLKERLNGVEFEGKTGTLNRVVALSGYVKHESGEVLRVAIVINNFSGTSASARAAADQFVRDLSKLGLSGTQFARLISRDSRASLSRSSVAARHRISRSPANRGPARPRANR